MINQFNNIQCFTYAHGGNTHALLLFATTLSENSIINVLISKINLVVRIRFTESGFGIRHYKSNQICSLLLVTDGYRSLQHVTDRYYSFLLLVVTMMLIFLWKIFYQNLMKFWIFTCRCRRSQTKNLSKNISPGLITIFSTISA